MSGQTVLNQLLSAGIRPRLTPDRTGIVVPRHAITDALKVAILANKPAIIRLLTEAANDAHQHPELAPPTAPAAPAHDRLLVIAMRYCDAGTGARTCATRRSTYGRDWGNTFANNCASLIYSGERHDGCPNCWPRAWPAHRPHG